MPCRPHSHPEPVKYKDWNGERQLAARNFLELLSSLWFRTPHNI